MDPEPRRVTTQGSRRNRWLVVAVVGPTIVIGLALLFDWWPMIRGGFGWRWPYAAPELTALARYLPFAFGLAVYLLGIRLFSRAASWLYVGWCVVATLLLSLAALAALGDPLYLLLNRTISGVTTGGFSVAIRLDDVGNAVRQWPELMPTFEKFSSHMAISPPGWPLAYALLAKALDSYAPLARLLSGVLRPLQCNDIPLMQLSNGQIASAWLGIASPLWGALTIIPLYDLGRRVGDAKVARLASAWWPLVPSLIMFLGTLSTPYPLASVTIFWFFWIGLERLAKHRVAAGLLVAGALTGLALLYSFAFLPFILFLGLFTLLHWQDFGRRPFRLGLRQPVLAGLHFGAGLVTILILYTALTGHTPLAVFQSAMAYHVQLARSYWPWIVLHLWDYALFLGLVVFLLALIGAFRYTKAAVRTMAVALTLTLFIVLVSGTGRGETGRIWLFFAPFSLLIAADVLGAFSQNHQRLLLASQLLWLFGLVLVLRTVDGIYVPPPELAAVRYATVDEPAIETAVDFGDELQLQGFSGTIQTDPGLADPAQLSVDLYWHPNRPIETPYFFSAVVVSPEGLPMTDLVWQPFDYQFPTTCWYEASQQGRIIDRVTVPLSEPAVVGDYWVSLRMFALDEDGKPLYMPLNVPGAGQQDQVGLGPIRTAGSAAE